MKSIFGWLKNSTKIKRWIFLMLLGMILSCYGFAEIIASENPLVIKDLMQIVITFVAGIAAFITGLVFLQKRTLELAVLQDEKSMKKIGETKDRGPKIVIIGGGIGLNRIITGLKEYTNNITAIVTVSTYGNDEARKPTDAIIDSIASLSKNEESMKNVMKTTVNKVSFGELYLKAMASANGELAKGIEESNKILAMVGKVLPVTLDQMHICVELDDGTVIEEREKISEVTTNKVTKINRVYIKPTNCRTTPGIIETIKNADAIVIGPGSLYTEVIPNLLIRNVARAIRESKAYKIYVANIMTESGHTDDYSLSDHIKVIKEHAGEKIIDYCIADNGDIIPEVLRKYNKSGANLVEIDRQNIKDIEIVKADVSEVDGNYIRHNSDLIAKQIIEIIVNDLKFKDKKTSDHFVLLNAKLKEARKKTKSIKKPKNKIKKVARGKSKFSHKYQERIESIRESENTRNINKRIHERAKKMTDEVQKEEKERFLEEIKGGKHVKTKQK